MNIFSGDLSYLHSKTVKVMDSAVKRMELQNFGAIVNILLIFNLSQFVCFSDSTKCFEGGVSIGV